MAESAAVYIPIDRRHALVAGRPLPRRAQGAALFADISGFTPLTELLARELGARRGAEELTGYLNQVYEDLIAWVHQYGGTVTGFAGDAITCWFAEDEGRRAVACALAMQEAMGRFSEIAVGEGEGSTISLAVKVAVATGAVQRFVVGDPHYTLLDVLAGVTLERLSEAEQLAQTGEVVVDSATAAALEGWLEAGAWRHNEQMGERFAVVGGIGEMPPPQPWAVLPSEALTDDQVRPWLLRPVYQRLQAGQGEYLAELRPAVVLFLRFEGIDYDEDPEAEKKLDGFVREVQKILHQSEGSLLQLTIGDKGSFLYAAFGAPLAHEDDVDRALGSALAMARLTEQFPYLMPFRVGITRGRMRVGAYGGSQRRTYGVLGDAVNLSARLMVAAQPGQILVSDEVRDRAGPHFVWESLPAVRVKGKREEVSVSRLLRARRRLPALSLESAFPRPPLGRAHSMGRLREPLQELLVGRGRVVRLTGEAGMGKSHLAAQLAREALAEGARVAYGAAQSASNDTPYLPWRQIFYDLLDVEGQDEAATISWLAHYVEQRQPRWSVRLPLLGDLLGLPVSDNATTAALSSDVRQEALFSLLAEMARWEAQQRPLLLIVDNVQWMDEASQQLTMALARGAVSAAPILLLLLERVERDGAATRLAALAQLPGYGAVHLNELQEGTVADLAAERLPGTGAPPAPLLVSVVHQVSRGNPFIVGELLAALHDGGQLEQRADGSWQVGDALLSQLQRANVIALSGGEWRLRPGIDFSKIPLGLPDSIHGLILSRLDRLPEAPKMTLKVCSVVGYLVDLLLVAGAHPEEKGLERIRTESEELRAQAILRKEQPEQDIYAFAHHMTQEVVYETLLYNQRRQLHRALAQTLVELQPDAVIPIAYHAYLGQEWALSMRYNLQAGEQAKQLHANQQALAFLERALESCHHIPHEEIAQLLLRLNLALGELSVQMGRHEEAQGYLQSALWLAREEGDREGEASAHRWQARSHEQRGDYGLALEVIEKGLAALQDQLSPEAAELYLIAGLIKARQGQFEQALDYCHHSLETAELLDDTAIRARTYNLMGIIELRNDSAAAIQRFSQSLVQYKEIGDIYGQATSHNLIANGYFALASWGQADHHYRQALDLFTQTGNLYKQVLVNNNLGGIALKQGRLGTALAYYERAVDQLEQSGGSLWVLGALHLNMGHVLLEQGQLQGAGEELELARDYFDQVQTRDLLPELLGLLADLAFRRGELAEAERLGEASLAMAREMMMPREEGYTLRIMGEIAQARGLYREAEDYFHDSYMILREAGDQYERTRTQFSLAVLYSEIGRVEEARRQLSACETVFRRLEAWLDMEKVRALWQRLHVTERVR